MTVRSSRSRRSRTAASSSGAISSPAGSSSGSVGWDEDRCEHRGLEHHREREVAREAHPDRADARTAALLVRQPRQRPQPLVTGLDWLAAKARNSALTHARWKMAVPSSAPGTAPSRPNSEGMYTVNPASLTQRLKRATCGLMPGISVMTITAGPVPVTCTTFVDAVEGYHAGIEVVERIVLVHVPLRHPRRSVRLYPRHYTLGRCDPQPQE